MNKYEFFGFVIPEYMRDGIAMYIKYGVDPGSFLTAVICNDLKNAVGQADEINLKNIPAYVNYFYNHAPIDCWGSKAAMNGWIGKKLQERKGGD